MALSPAAVFALARAAGFDAVTAATMTAIAGGESGWNPDAVGDTALQDETWGPSIGLWQIRSLRSETGKGTARDASRLTDPAFNAHAAFEIYQSQGLGAWSVYSSGSYRSYLSQVADVSTNAADPGGSATTAQSAGIFDGAAATLWDSIKPFALTSLFAVGGIALVVLGVGVTVSPTAKKATNVAPAALEALT